MFSQCTWREVLVLLLGFGALCSGRAAGLVCKESYLVSSCKVEHFEYQPGDLKESWQNGLHLSSTYQSEISEDSNLTFGFGGGTLQLGRTPASRLWDRDGACTRQQVLFFLPRNYQNVFHFISDQLMPYAWALRAHSMDAISTQLVALDGARYHSHRVQQFQTLSDAWVDLTGSVPIDFEEHLDEPLCGQEAIFARANFLMEYGSEQPLESIRQLRPDYSWFSTWLLAKLNLHWSPQGSQTRVTLIDRSHSGYRRLLNSSTLIQWLSDRSLHVSLAHMEVLSFTEQVSLMTRTDVLFTPHGAAESLLSFLPPWAVVVELRSYGFGTMNLDFYHGYCNLARLASRTFIAWHDSVRTDRPADFSGFTDWKDLDLTLGTQEAVQLLEQTEKLLLVPPDQRNHDICIAYNSPAEAA